VRARFFTASLSRWAAAVAFAAAGLLWTLFLTNQRDLPMHTWLLDWHVYAAGARDFMDQTLYRVPLESAYSLPIGEFNYPPMAAVSVIPLLVLPDAVGGTIWVVLNLLAIPATVFLLAKIAGARVPLLWAGLGFLAFSLHPWMQLALLGNNTPVVLLLVTGFAYQHLARRDRSAGLLLGAAIVLKLWPLAVIPLLVRERRGTSLTVAVGTTAVVAVATLAWLGPDIVPDAARAMQAKAEIESDNPVFYISWLRETQSWWPEWGGFAFAATLALFPAGGRLGIGLAIFAGLALVPNLWRTYAMTLIVAGVLVLIGVRESWDRLFKARSASTPARGRSAPTPGEP
jgi:hypothetical protein